jgi:hypothetical protein
MNSFAGSVLRGTVLHSPLEQVFLISETGLDRLMTSPNGSQRDPVA